LFGRIGCVSCHSAKLGAVEGLFSDLLLHDMGADTGDSGSYNGGDPDESTEEPLNPKLTSPVFVALSKAPATPRGATRTEWRTPPLWGLRDSGPYLHDGRAQTIDQAVSFHGGQGAASAHRYFELTPRERLQVDAFLKSLVAPTTEIARAGR